MIKIFGLERKKGPPTARHLRYVIYIYIHFFSPFWLCTYIFTISLYNSYRSLYSIAGQLAGAVCFGFLDGWRIIGIQCALSSSLIDSLSIHIAGKRETHAEENKEQQQQ
jgi:hypothetical protein